MYRRVSISSRMIRALIFVGAVFATCPDYEIYSQQKHEPLSSGPLKLSSARPEKACRSVSTVNVEKTIAKIKGQLKDPDLARIFENSYPNALDTAIQFYQLPTNKTTTDPHSAAQAGFDLLPIRYVVQQLRPYRRLLTDDSVIAGIYQKVIKHHVEALSGFPDCARPPALGIQKPIDQDTMVQGCKFDTDSLAYFLEISADYLQYAIDPLFFDKVKWLDAIEKLLDFLHGHSATLQGRGCDAKDSCKLIRYALRPSDEQPRYPFVIPSNGYLSAQLSRAAEVASSLIEGKSTTIQLRALAASIKRGIETHGIVDSSDSGRVYAYEVDGSGNHVLLDDAKFPSLLSLPITGFVDVKDQVYQNTRKLAMSRNAYYYTGRQMKGIGSPSTGPKRPWPLSLLYAVQTTKDREEVSTLLGLVGNSTAGLGLIHESVNANDIKIFSRPWYPIGNSWFADTILDTIERFPGLLS